MNEKQIQNYLYWNLNRKHNLLCPNIFLYNWESDFVSITKAGYANEYEIKVSKSDFKVDRINKVEKFQILENGFLETKTDWEKKKFGDKRVYQRPSMFWYVCPENLIDISEIPEYTGLIHVKESGSYYRRLITVKKPKKLGKEKISEELQKKILISIYYRYWNLRPMKESI